MLAFLGTESWGYISFVAFRVIVDIDMQGIRMNRIKVYLTLAYRNG